MTLRNKKSLINFFVQLSSYLTMPSDLRKIFISLEDGIFLFNSKDEILEVNPKGKTIYQAKGYKLYDLVHCLLYGKTQEECDEIIASIKERRDEVTFECFGEGKAYLVTVFFICNIKKCLVNTIVMIHEITKQKELQLELQKRNDTLFKSIELYKKQLQIVNTLEEERERLKLLQTIQNSILVQVEDVMDQVNKLRKDEDYDEEIWRIQLSNLAEEIRGIILEVRTAVVNLKV